MDSEKEKVTLKMEQGEETSFEYREETIKVKKFISSVEEVALIQAYIENYFYPEDTLVSNVKYDYLGAEYNLALSLLDVFTNIKLEETDEEGESRLLVNINEIYESPLWREIVSRISNYENFRNMLYMVVEDKRKEIELERSFGVVLDGLFSKIESLLTDVSETFSNPEALEKLRNDFSEALEKLDKAPYTNIFREANQDKKVL